MGGGHKREGFSWVLVVLWFLKVFNPTIPHFTFEDSAWCAGSLQKGKMKAGPGAIDEFVSKRFTHYL